jgi:hypothetical protein
MEVEVRCFLSTKDAVVLKRKYSEGSISLDERLCDSFSRDHYSPALTVRKFEQRRDMPTRDNAALPDFELPRIYHGKRMFALVYDRPPFFASGHPFTKVARISYGKFDQLLLRISGQADERAPIELALKSTLPIDQELRKARRGRSQRCGWLACRDFPFSNQNSLDPK